MDQLTKQKQREYKKLVDKMSPGSEVARSLIKAFFVGGVICAVGQIFRMFSTDYIGLTSAGAGSLTSVIMVFLGCTLTGIGVYDNIGKFAGAGSIVPITGFANSIVAPAMEFKREGYVLGVAAKMFTIAGPVLVYGISSSVIVGVIYWLAMRLGVIL